MKLTQSLGLRNLLVPELNQSLKILSLTLTELRSLVEQELENNPFLEEKMAVASTSETGPGISVRSYRQKNSSAAFEEDFDPFAQLAGLPSLQETLYRQLEITVLTSEELLVGREIIGNIDDNGYLRASLEELAAIHSVPLVIAEKTLKVIHTFEPFGVAARSIQECLLIQCDAIGLDDPLLRQIIVDHLEDVARKKYEFIARQLKVTLSEVEACIKKLTTLDPKPGQNYSTERPSDIIPDIVIEEKDGVMEITINKENIPSIYINEEYRHILKNKDLTPQAKEFLKGKLQEALELLRAISRRQNTLRNSLEVITEIQKDALLNGFSRLKPLTFQEVADKIGMHASTVCRVVMNKYAQTPQGVVPLKSFFTSGIPQEDGQETSSSLFKIKIRELIESEDKTTPLSDEDLAAVLLKENGVRIARRTVAKYREELKLASSSLRRER